MKKAALIIVDVQKDFCPRGRLAVKDGDEIIPKINKVTRDFLSADLPIFFTRDWHPPNHCSFVENGGMWPRHCVQYTKGAMFHERLFVPPTAIIISKGTEPDKEAYSGFEGTELEKELKNLKVNTLVVTGLATDYCVKNTVIDALSLGFKVILLEDCTKGVNLRPDDSEMAIKVMKEKGALITSSQNLKLEESGHAASLSSS